MKVFVYRNVRRACYSVKALEGVNKGHVVAHADSLMLSDAAFKVSEAGRQWVLRAGRKAVHAGIVGELQQIPAPLLGRHGSWVRVGYNPRRQKEFQTTDGSGVVAASVVLCLPDKVLIPAH